MIVFDEKPFASVPDFFSITREPLPKLSNPSTSDDDVLHEGDFFYWGRGVAPDFHGLSKTPATVLCSASRCCLKVQHPDRFCPIHTHLIDPEPEWAKGTVHPAGGYDEVRTDEIGSGVSYLLDGRLHRLDGPARVGPDGREWWVDGRLHRLDGPAIEGLGGPRSFWSTYMQTSTHYVYGQPVPEPHFALVVEALESGAPVEWALAYADGVAE